MYYLPGGFKMVEEYIKQNFSVNKIASLTNTQYSVVKNLVKSYFNDDILFDEYCKKSRSITAANSSKTRKPKPNKKIEDIVFGYIERNNIQLNGVQLKYVNYVIEKIKKKPIDKKFPNNVVIMKFILSQLENYDDSDDYFNGWNYWESNDFKWKWIDKNCWISRYGNRVGEDLFFLRMCQSSSLIDTKTKDELEEIRKNLISGNGKFYEDKEKPEKKLTIFCFEFWMGKGYSEEESKVKVSDIQKENAKKYLEKYPTKEDKQQFSVRHTSYWINKGYIESEAIEKVKERQATFSLEKCVEKYGEMGYNIWKERQDKWQQTINSKSVEEIETINRRKAITLENQIEKHGQELGIIKYNEFLIKKAENFKLGYSKSSRNFFIKLYKKLRKANIIERKDVYFGVDGSKEYFIFDGEKVRFYDFCIPKLKYMCEYNGVAFHPRSNQFDWKSAFGMSYEEAFNNDEFKRNLANENGFILDYVWEDEDPQIALETIYNNILDIHKKLCIMNKK